MRRALLLLAAIAVASGCHGGRETNNRPDGGLGSGGSPGSAGGTGGAGGGTTAASVGCAKQVASGTDHACVLYDDGRVACLGGNALGQLGIGTTEAAAALMPTLGVEDVRLLAAGGDHTCALGRGGLYCWGDNRASELGVTGMEQARQAVLTAAPGTITSVPIVQLALGSRHGCVLDQFVHGYCWGTGASGISLPSIRQLGSIGHQPFQILQLGGAETRVLDGGRLFDVPWRAETSVGLTPPPGAPDRIVANVIGQDHECLLKASGTVWCRGGAYPAFYSVAADFGSEVAEVAVGVGFTCARTRAGTVLCRGRNESGQLGDGSLNRQDVTVAVSGIGPAVELSLGARHGCARLTDGSVWCWGALGGAIVRSTAERIAGPVAAQTCSGVTSVPLPWTATVPEGTPADELNDALVAFGQNQCRCVFADERDRILCMRDETFVLNGCLPAVGAGAGETASCLSQAPWAAATCWAKCVDTPSFTAGLPQCTGAPQRECGETRGALRFCLRTNLFCDGSGSAAARNFETCDGKADCPNGFDEANCTPGSTMFRCADGSSVGLGSLQDGTRDCPDGSDEW